MKAVDFYFWIVPQPGKKKPQLTRWRMTMEDGRKQFPQGEPDLSSKETRMLPDTEEERAFLGAVSRPDPPGPPPRPGWMHDD